MSPQKPVVILGHGPSRIECPYDPDIPIWGVNNVYTFCKIPLTRLYIVDKITEKEFDFSALEQINEIVGSEPRPDHPEWRIRVYPIKEIMAFFKTNYFSNCIAFMMAEALYEGYDEMRFFGIDMATQSSYIFERPGVDYWLGIAHAMGCVVRNTKNSSTGRTIDNRIYGFWPQLGGDNRQSYSKAVAEESGRLVRNLMYGVPEKDKAKVDPDGHLERRDKVFRSEIERDIAARGIFNDLAQETRDLVATFPGFKDESSEWEQDTSGAWVRKPQKIVGIPKTQQEV